MWIYVGQGSIYPSRVKLDGFTSCGSPEEQRSIYPPRLKLDGRTSYAKSRENPDVVRKKTPSSTFGPQNFDRQNSWNASILCSLHLRLPECTFAAEKIREERYGTSKKKLKRTLHSWSVSASLRRPRIHLSIETEARWIHVVCKSWRARIHLSTETKSSMDGRRVQVLKNWLRR